jgi:hypothetical protein
VLDGITCNKRTSPPFLLCALPFVLSFSSFSLLFCTLPYAIYREGCADCRNFLLASSGLNPSETSKTISSLHLREGPVREVPQGAPAVDVQTFLAERRTQNILSAIEKGLARSSASFTTELARHRNTSWEALKRRTLERHRGIISGDGSGNATLGSVGQFDGFGQSRYPNSWRELMVVCLEGLWTRVWDNRTGLIRH